MKRDDLFACTPLRTEEGILVFGREADGDCFDESDVEEWRSGRLAANWTKRELLDNPAVRPLLERIAQDEDCLIDLAAGPGLGLIPSVNQLRPGFQAMATDANLMVLREWRRFLVSRNTDHVDFAQCSLMALPFREGSVRACSSMIGLSSTRGGEAGYAAALAEVYRTLAPGGKFYAVEAEWSDVPGILALFEKMGQQPWDVFLQQHSTWPERFRAAGFTVLYAQESEYFPLAPDDNELGAAAARYGVQIGLRRFAYIVQK